MKYLKFFLTLSGFIFLYYFIAPNMLYAYLDAGTGSYLIQIIIAIALGGAFGIKIFWRRIFEFFKRLSSKGSKQNKIVKGKDE
jgi:hypothetical protein